MVDNGYVDQERSIHDRRSEAHVFTAERLHGDDTISAGPVCVLVAVNANTNALLRLLVPGLTCSVRGT